MATASTRLPHPRTLAAQGCRRVTQLPAWLQGPSSAESPALQIQEDRLSESPVLGGTSLTHAAQAGGSIPEVHPCAAPWCRGGPAGLPAVEVRCSHLDMCLHHSVPSARKHQPGSESWSCSHKQASKITPTRTAFIPTNELCCGAAIKHSIKHSIKRCNSSGTRNPCGPTPWCLLSPSLSPCQLLCNPLSLVLPAQGRMVLLAPLSRARVCTVGMCMILAAAWGDFKLQGVFQEWLERNLSCKLQSSISLQPQIKCKRA